MINFIVIMMVQLFILNDIVIKSSITLMGIPVFIPLIYPLILLLLPVNTPHWLTMLLGFMVGITMDLFSNTPGVHASACVVLGYVRPYLLNLFFQQNIKELGDTVPTLFRMGFRSFLLYILFALVIHHCYYYIIQIWSFKNILLIVYKTILSTLLSIILIILSQLIFAKKEIRRI
ncbi:MAG: rod shape-determining protein MreD [Bacteroidetes bacterium]|jgi:rod shape-determining protein MreD|nr:rod shape-determining protein MreD [Bacteroidota bacterium]MBK7588629.1 rod shape-determining protein MreD [Bacteroidota bacterium]MBK8328684.1 rod shape-determining protein MreD [Bacteroidota bacterium]MBK9301995.1 rod shape-determining protein MreD [Bacteroidota bacterium]